MNHRTQIYLDIPQYEYLKGLAQVEKKSMAEIIREWIEEKRTQKRVKRTNNDPFLKARGLFKSGHASMARDFDQHLYGRKK